MSGIITAVAALALVAGVTLGWIDVPFVIGLLVAGSIIGWLEYRQLQVDRKRDRRR